MTDRVPTASPATLTCSVQTRRAGAACSRWARWSWLGRSITQMGASQNPQVVALVEAALRDLTRPALPGRFDDPAPHDGNARLAASECPRPAHVRVIVRPVKGPQVRGHPPVGLPTTVFTPHHGGMPRLQSTRGGVRAFVVVPIGPTYTLVTAGNLRYSGVDVTVDHSRASAPGHRGRCRHRRTGPALRLPSACRGQRAPASTIGAPRSGRGSRARSFAATAALICL
jgi:hypothetical protein